MSYKSNDVVSTRLANETVYFTLNWSVCLKSPELTHKDFYSFNIDELLEQALINTSLLGSDMVWSYFHIRSHE